MRNWKAYLLATAAVGTCGLAAPAEAQLVYAGGASFPAPVYRNLFDCHSVQVDGNPAGPTWPYPMIGTTPAGTFQPAYPISPFCPSATGDNSGLFMQILYVPVGSGGGKRALIAHDGSSNGTGFGAAPPVALPIVSGWIPGWTDKYGYPSVQFVGSDDVWNATDVANYTASGNQAKYGNIIQMPSLAGAVVIAFNGKDGNGTPLNIQNSVPAGATADKATFGYPGNYSGLNLTRKALCGIFTGHITSWDDPELKKSNNNVTLGTGTLKVVHRSDGSGTNFLFVNALYRQCQGVTGPLNTADALSASPSTRSWEFRFSDRTAAACPDALYRASNLINWPDFTNDTCTPAVALNNNPGGGVFLPGNTNGGVKTVIESTNGAIGYSTTDFSQPVLSTGMKVANVQSQYDVDNNTGAFQWPSPTRINNAMAAVNPILPDAAAIANPLNWSSQAQVPNPATPNSYPIAGFTWLDFYQCYSQTRDQGLGLGTYNNMFNYIGFHYYDTNAAKILNSQGFSTIPNSWRDPIIPLITGGPSMMGNAGDSSNPVCSTRQGA